MIILVYICVDSERIEIKSDKTINWIRKKVNQKRAMKGLTSSAKKARGLRSKHPTNKARPGRRAGQRKGN